MIARYLVGKFGQKGAYRIHATFLIGFPLLSTVLPFFLSREVMLGYVAVSLSIAFLLAVGLIRKRVIAHKKQLAWEKTMYEGWQAEQTVKARQEANAVQVA